MAFEWNIYNKLSIETIHSKLKNSNSHQTLLSISSRYHKYKHDFVLSLYALNGTIIFKLDVNEFATGEERIVFDFSIAFNGGSLKYFQHRQMAWSDVPKCVELRDVVSTTDLLQSRHFKFAVNLESFTSFDCNENVIFSTDEECQKRNLLSIPISVTSAKKTNHNDCGLDTTKAICASAALEEKEKAITEQKKPSDDGLSAISTQKEAISAFVQLDDHGIGGLADPDAPTPANSSNDEDDFHANAENIDDSTPRRASPSLLTSPTALPDESNENDNKFDSNHDHEQEEPTKQAEDRNTSEFEQKESIKVVPKANKCRRNLDKEEMDYEADDDLKTVRAAPIVADQQTETDRNNENTEILTEFKKGDMVLRKGRVCVIEQIDYSTRPPSATVQMQDTGDYVGTEFRCLQKLSHQKRNESSPVQKRFEEEDEKTEEVQQALLEATTTPQFVFRCDEQILTQSLLDEHNAKYLVDWNKSAMVLPGVLTEEYLETMRTYDELMTFYVRYTGISKSIHAASSSNAPYEVAKHPCIDYGVSSVPHPSNLKPDKECISVPFTVNMNQKPSDALPLVPPSTNSQRSCDLTSNVNELGFSMRSQSGIKRRPSRPRRTRRYSDAFLFGRDNRSNTICGSRKRTYSQMKREEAFPLSMIKENNVTSPSDFDKNRNNENMNVLQEVIENGAKELTEQHHDGSVNGDIDEIGMEPCMKKRKLNDESKNNKKRKRRKSWLQQMGEFIGLS